MDDEDDVGRVFLDRLMTYGVEFQHLKQALLQQSFMQKLASEICGQSGKPLGKRFISEVVSSGVEYPYEYGYGGSRDIFYGIMSIAETFNLDPARALAYAQKLPKLPDGAEGWFAVPAENALVREGSPGEVGSSDGHGRAIQRVLNEIATGRPLRDFSRSSDRARMSASDATIQALEHITAQQPGDILIIAAQLGLRYRGRSARSARELFLRNEFGLTSVEVGSILLTHPVRIHGAGCLSMNCVGDAAYEDGKGEEYGTQFLQFGVGIGFQLVPSHEFKIDFGHVSAFVP